MYKTLNFNLGRDALSYLVNLYQIKEMYIPYYLCDVVRHRLVAEGCRPLFYHVNDNFYPACEFPKDSHILYPNYFGICGANIKCLEKMYPKLIVDNAHAYFDEPLGFACFNAGHKFNYKNSVLWIENKFGLQTENFYDECDKECYKSAFCNLHQKYLSENLLSPIINPDAVSFVYPFLAGTEEQANELVKELKKKGKTVYRYWNSLPKDYNEYKFYSRLVPIPVLP